jgi:hypothetical protein
MELTEAIRMLKVKRHSLSKNILLMLFTCFLLNEILNFEDSYAVWTALKDFMNA